MIAPALEVDAPGEAPVARDDALVFEGVVKRYHRSATRALDELSFRVPRGVVCGLVGPNGAGKTTTFSVLSGFLPPDAGRIDILGLGPFDPWAMKGRLGVLPQDAELPERQTPLELLTHLARLQGIPARDAAIEARRRVDEVRLGDRATSRIGALSHGMRRRVAVASALLGDPELVVLDEPTSGLDPAQARSLRELLADLRGRRTVIVSSHNLLELELLCDWIVVVDRGRCVRQGSVGDLTGRGARTTWQLAAPIEADLVRARLPGCRVRVDGAQLEIEAPVDVDLDALTLTVMSLLGEQGIGLRGLRRGVTLEDSIVGSAHGSGAGDRADGP